MMTDKTFDACFCLDLLLRPHELILESILKVMKDSACKSPSHLLDIWRCSVLDQAKQVVAMATEDRRSSAVGEDPRLQYIKTLLIAVKEDEHV